MAIDRTRVTPCCNKPYYIIWTSDAHKVTMCAGCAHVFAVKCPMHVSSASESTVSDIAYDNLHNV